MIIFWAPAAFKMEYAACMEAPVVHTSSKII